MGVGVPGVDDLEEGPDDSEHGPEEEHMVADADAEGPALIPHLSGAGTPPPGSCATRGGVGH